jgi:hypothetical protein
VAGWSAYAALASGRRYWQAIGRSEELSTLETDSIVKIRFCDGESHLDAQKNIFIFFDTANLGHCI